jgi:putative DNA primase/helicase
MTTKITHDGFIHVAIGRSRKDTNWKNTELLWSDFLAKLQVTTRTRESFEQYKKLPKDQRDNIKDVGGFVGGTLSGGRRKRGSVKQRSLLTLDADYASTNLWEDFCLLWPYACAVYSTHSHSPEAPRLRFIIPLSREVTPEEYEFLARIAAAGAGIDYFDDTTYDPCRLMYWPSTASDGEFIFDHIDGPWLNPDNILAKYPSWQDVSTWPESSRVHNDRKKLADKQGDPRTKPGMVGAFCATYTVTEVIQAFIPDIYIPCDAPNRYTYAKGSTAAGLIIYDDDLFAYSHHGTDPAGGQLCNAFDLVRIHKFGQMDEDKAPDTPINKLPSYLAMTDFAKADPAVQERLNEACLERAAEEFACALEPDNAQELKKQLRKLDRDSNGAIRSTIDNYVIILENDINLAGIIGYDEFSHRIVLRKDAPWRNVKNKQDGDPWKDEDDAALRHYIEKVWHVTSAVKIADAVAIVQAKNQFHPVRDYLSSLRWDGNERLDSLFIDYLGAEDCPYTRAVTRKSLVAAVARIMRPGCKFDYMPVLVGKQGLGKSYMISRLGGRWFSDSLTCVTGKEAYEQLHGYWIFEMAEMAATKKVEIEAIKHFITKQEDVFRLPYGRRTSQFPRQCVFFGTTNDQEFLRDRTGNRRFWPVDIGVIAPTKSLWEDLTQDEINQVWAEAVVRYAADESLYLDANISYEASIRQDKHSEGSEKVGQIEMYLETLLPDNWNSLDIYSRKNFLHGDFDTAKGTVKRQMVCVSEIWVEAFDGDLKQLNSAQAREIAEILRKLGWERKDGQTTIPIYGRQRVFVRT